MDVYWTYHVLGEFSQVRQQAGMEMNSRIDTHVGNRVRMAREFRGFRSEELARRLGLSLLELTSLERGDIRFDPGCLSRAAKALRARPELFFAGTDESDETSSFVCFESNLAHANDNGGRELCDYCDIDSADPARPADPQIPRTPRCLR